ncbi:GNAT family N-acetyltransferase [Paenibacillus ginsengarvi]|uniref:N-acetyltransferase n=1 Tax=Paenibacillus ginsengarvi TaxID=400777 RepID=A0A3B0BIP4_9BACL|nr:GNAT family N-acetyltransferase [Paenibacillus ginsengarvi]RKN72993.1 N-acetyltransferase [Paenibacillus ginsengarvi]
MEQSGLGSVSFTIEPVTESTQEQAKAVVLSGMEEHFGFLDPTLNPDLDHIVSSYLEMGHTFLVGRLSEDVVCTGALMGVDAGTGRLVRMSVRKEHRRHGYASRMIAVLEQLAAEKGYSAMMLKTIVHWTDAVGFYEKMGYERSRLEGRSVTMVKSIRPEGLSG